MPCNECGLFDGTGAPRRGLKQVGKTIADGPRQVRRYRCQDCSTMVHMVIDPVVGTVTESRADPAPEVARRGKAKAVRNYEVSYTVAGMRCSCVVPASSEEEAKAFPRVVADVARLRGTGLSARPLAEKRLDRLLRS